MEEAEMIKPFWKEGKKRKEVARSSGTRRMTRVRPSPPIATYVPIFWSLAQIDLTHASSAEHSIHLAPLQTATGNSSAFYHSAANKGVVCANRVSPAMKAGQLFSFLPSPSFGFHPNYQRTRCLEYILESGGSWLLLSRLEFHHPTPAQGPNIDALAPKIPLFLFFISLPFWQ